MACSSLSKKKFSLEKIRSNNPKISAPQNGKGFDQQVLRIKPKQKKSKPCNSGWRKLQHRVYGHLQPAIQGADGSSHQKPFKNLRSGQRRNCIFQ
jgi:hypothetical protein